MEWLRVFEVGVGVPTGRVVDVGSSICWLAYFYRCGIVSLYLLWTMDCLGTAGGRYCGLGSRFITLQYFMTLSEISIHLCLFVSVGLVGWFGSCVVGSLYVH